jgi:hypothetical protein
MGLLPARDRRAPPVMLPLIWSAGFFASAMPCAGGVEASRIQGCVAPRVARCMLRAAPPAQSPSWPPGPRSAPARDARRTAGASGDKHTRALQPGLPRGRAACGVDRAAARARRRSARPAGDAAPCAAPWGCPRTRATWSRGCPRCEPPWRLARGVPRSRDGRAAATPAGPPRRLGVARPRAAVVCARLGASQPRQLYSHHRPPRRTRPAGTPFAPRAARPPGRASAPGRGARRQRGPRSAAAMARTTLTLALLACVLAGARAQDQCEQCKQARAARAAARAAGAAQADARRPPRLGTFVFVSWSPRRRTRRSSRPAGCRSSSPLRVSSSRPTRRAPARGAQRACMRSPHGGATARCAQRCRPPRVRAAEGPAPAAARACALRAAAQPRSEAR